MHNLSEKILFEALTYDDVLLLPGYSEVLPREVDTSTQLTRNIRLNVPIVSAAMDTVTEHRMAIALAQEGGIGFLHKNNPITIQADEVKRVKRSESGMILDPIVLEQTATIGDAMFLMHEHKIGGIPIINHHKILVGILTNRDLRFEKNKKKPVTEVMVKENLITAEEGTDLKKAEGILQRYRIEKLPVVNKKGELVGLITYRDIIKKKDFPKASKDTLGRLRVGAAVGVTEDMMERVDALINAGADVLSIDTAHGHSKGVILSIKSIRKKYPDMELIAGNIATSEGAKALIDAGVDGIKVGIGPGSICTTRIIAGIGVPQLSAIYLASIASKKKNIPIIADGGIKFTGDIPKAIAAGASTVMTGFMLAGSEESPGETIIFDGRKFKSYRGMGSIDAMKHGSRDRYFQDPEDEIAKLVPEGIEGQVPYKGTVSEIIYQLVGGLKASMGYCGAANIEALKKAKFVKITSSGMHESHPHGVQITKEAPNYSR
ncbi:MAG: IMP dehydrogenase [Bacteroidetes bacterium RIFCSPLOWO2_12_FULL_37_12]|nr:MAG: IMP dehydrogenase [Bacteroidetes bacterium RIFCSPLOWO2_12_FULL_37_12]